MLWPERVRIKRHVAVIELDAETVGRRSVWKVLRRVHHPAKRDVRQAGFVLRVAAADVGVVVGKPDLLQPIGILVGSFRPVCTENLIRVDEVTESPKLAR